MIEIKSELENLSTAATQVIEACKGAKIWLFEGEMGSGKTTLISEICQQFGVKNRVQSPTFSIVNEYQTIDNQIIYHFDCYRLKNINEAFDIGLEEYFSSGNYCFVEWPELILELIDDPFCRIQIEKISQNERLIRVKL